MKVQRSHLRIALFVLAAAVLYNVWVFVRPAARPAQAGPPPQPLLAGEAPPATDAQQAIDPVSIPAPPPIEVAAGPSAARDPFLFGDETRDDQARKAAEYSPDPLVRTILFSSTRKTAIVDGKMVSIGDSVGSLKVTDIERTAVVFTTAGGEQRRVPLHAAPPAGIRR